MADKTTPTRMDKDRGHDANRDPISGAPGAHPVGTGVGAAAGGAAAGAAAGTVAGPVGTVVGAAAGAIVGGLAGKAVAESVNPTAEEAYWRENYRNEPYYESNYTYDDYSNAYRTGYEGYSRLGKAGKTYDQVETDLQRQYETNKAASRLNWEKARPAVRAAWGRFEQPRSQRQNKPV